MPADTIIIRIEMLDGGRTRLDWLSLTIDPTAGVEPRIIQSEPLTWGRIKTLWK
ncbi:MAG: hypothetical protein PVJ42_08865 [bacterium]|jgi:hypothetical protein